MSANFEAMVKIGATDAGASATIDKVNKSLKETAQTGQMSAKAIANAYRQLPAQFQDIGVSLAGGQNPLMVLLQQGSQIATQFGGVGAAFRAVGGVLMSTTGAFTAAAGGVAAFGYAALKGADESVKLTNKLTLMGGAAGATADQIELAIKRIDALANVTSGDARDVIGGLIGTFDPAMFDRVAATIVKISDLSGQTRQDVTKDMVAMADGVAQWALKHQKSYNYLTIDQFKYIKALEDSGQKEKALKENMRLLDAAFTDREARLGTLEKLWKGLADTASKAWDAMLGIGRDVSVADQMATLQSQIAAARAVAHMPKLDAMGAPTGGTYGDDIPELEARLAALKKSQVDEAKIAAERAKFTKQTAAMQAEMDGTAEALRNAERERALAAERAYSEANIRILEERRAQLDALHEAGLIDDREYAKKKLVITRADLDEQIRVVNKEIELEEKRQAVGADAIKRQTRLIELNEKLQALVGKKGIESIKTGGELGALDFKDEQAAAKRAQEGIERFLKTYKDATEDVRQLVAENAEAAAALVVDPMERARLQLQAEFLKIDAKYKEMRDSLMNQRDIAGASGNFRRSDELQALIDQLDEAIKKSKELAKQKGPATDWLDGAKRGLNDYATAALDVASQTQAAFSKAFQGLETMLTDFFMTGKMNFKDFARSIIQDMIQIMIRTQITGPLAQALGGGNLLGSLLGGFGGPKAAGGPVEGGKTYLVGEKGPELFTARNSGTIIPNNALGGSTNTNNVVVNVNVENGQAQVQGDQGASNLGRLIAGAVKAELINQKRPGGLLAA